MNIYKELLNYPDNCLDDRKVHKTLIYETGELKTKDKKIIEQNIEQITWKYAFTKNSLNIDIYTDDEREYIEVEVIEVLLRVNKNITRIADILFRTMTHPSLLFFKYENEINLYVAHVRNHKSNYAIFTYDEIIKTGWIKLDKLTENSQKLLHDLKLENLNYTNFYTLYDDVCNAIIDYECRQLTNKISTTSPEEKKKLLKEINKIDLTIRDIKAQIKKNINFNEIVEYNTLINKYMKEKDDLIKKL